MNSSLMSAGSDRITNGGWNGSCTDDALPVTAAKPQQRRRRAASRWRVAGSPRACCGPGGRSVWRSRLFTSPPWVWHGSATPAGQLVRGLHSRTGCRCVRRVTQERRDPALHGQQQLLSLHAARVAAKTAARVQHPVAGHDDRDRVGAKRVARRARPARAAGRRRNLACSWTPRRTGSARWRAARGAPNPWVSRQSIGTSNSCRRR